MYPTIEVLDTKSGTVAVDSNSWTLTYPTSLSRDELILLVAAIDGSTTVTLPAGWQTMRSANNSGIVSQIVAAKISLGTETGTFTMSLSASEQGAWRIFRIKRWYGFAGLSNAFATQGQNDGLAVTPSTSGGTGSDTAPTTSNCIPMEPTIKWAPRSEVLWFAIAGIDASADVTAFPLPDNQSEDTSGGANGTTLAICTQNTLGDNANFSAFDPPSNYTISPAASWITIMFAVRPADILGSDTAYVPGGHGAAW